MESLEDPCDTCGNFGFAELMATCSTCPARQHIYCAAQVMHEVPEEWHCEECQFPDEVNRSMFHLEEESIAMVPSLTSREGPKSQRKSKVKFLSPEEVIKLSLGERERPSVSHMCLKPNAASSARQNPLKSKVFASKSLVMEKGNHHLVSSGCQHPLKSQSLNIVSSINQLRQISAAKELKDGMNFISGKKDLVPRPKKHVDEDQLMFKMEAKEESMKLVSPISPSRCSQPFDKSGKKDLVLWPEKHVDEEQSMDIDEFLLEREAKEESMKLVSPISPSRCSQPFNKSGDDNDAAAEYGYSFEEIRFLHHILPKLGVYWPYLPALCATWSGSLKFPGDAIRDDSSYSFRAHPPCSVHRKAYELSLQMPMEIRLEPIPLTQILTDIFQKEGPDIGDIGLYFYPADAVNRHIAKYSALVQLMVSQEYAMRGLVNGAELLLFTSKELHADSHLFIAGLQSEYFLWGIFLSAKSTLACKSLHEELDVHPPLSVVDHSNNGHPISDKSSTIDSITVFIAGLQSEYFLWGIFYSAKSTLACKSLHEELDVHPPLSVVDHSNNGHPISNKSSTIDSITGIDELSRNASNGGSISHEEGTIDEIALPRTDFVESFQEHAQDVVMPPAAANYTCSSLIETTLNVKIEDTCSELVGSSSGVETPKQSNQQVNFEVQEITSDKHDIIKRSSKLPSKIEKPDKKVGSPKQGCSFRNWVKLNTSGITGGSTGSSGAGGVEAPKQSDQQVKVEVQEITSNKHDVVERSPKLLPKIEKPNEKVGLPEQSCSFRNWVKLNTSGITRGSTGSAGVGGTVHTSSGKWVFGYSFQLGKWSSLAADLWAIFQGLNLVWDRNYRKVLVLSDSYLALNSLKTAPQASDPNKDLIQCCRELILRNWECNVSHISREKNAAAAWLADHSQLYPMGLTKLDEPPQELAHILKNQDNGISPPS